MVGLTAALLLGLVAVEGFGNPSPAKEAPGGTAIERDSPRHEVRLRTPDRRLRSTDARMRGLIADGERRSSTFASLMAALEKTDVIVYVERVRHMPATIAGRLLFVPTTSGQRYLRIQLGGGGTAEDAISTLAHEIQHAIEIATSSEVRDQESLAKFYQRIGQLSIGAHAYDTVAARAAGRRVRQELGG